MNLLKQIILSESAPADLQYVMGSEASDQMDEIDRIIAEAMKEEGK